MFEIGKRYRATMSLNLGNIAGNLEKGEIYTRIKNRETGEHGDYMDKNGKILDGWGDCCFDSTPIDDTPAPRMVTTCDIGARVVRVKIDERWSKDYGCPIGGMLTIGKMCTDNKSFTSLETGLYYLLSEFVLADEQSKKEAEIKRPTIDKYTNSLPMLEMCKSCTSDFPCEGCTEFSKRKKLKADKGTDKTPPALAPGIASVMFGSKPRLMFGSLMQIQGPTKDEELRNARTEEERKKYENIHNTTR